MLRVGNDISGWGNFTFKQRFDLKTGYGISEEERWPRKLWSSVVSIPAD